MRDTQELGFERLKKSKNQQKENERVKQQKFKNQSITLLSILAVILFFLVPLIISFHISLNYFYVYIGFLTFIAIVPNTKEIIKNHWNYYDIKIYNFLNKSEIGLVIMYKVEENNENGGNIKRETIEIENISKYTQNIGSLFIYLATKPLYTFTEKIYLVSGDTLTIHFYKGENSQGIYILKSKRIYGDDMVFI